MKTSFFGEIGPLSIFSLGMLVVMIGFMVRACDVPGDNNVAAKPPADTHSEASMGIVGSGSAIEDAPDSSWMWTDTSYVIYVTDTFGIYTKHTNGMMAMFRDSDKIGYASADGTMIATMVGKEWWQCDSLKMYTSNPASCNNAVDKQAK